MSETTTIAFIGLGVMGGPMAGHLARAGHQVTAYNRSPQRAEKWRAKWSNDGLDVAFTDTIEAAVKDAEFVFTCVGNDEDLVSVTLDDGGVLQWMPAGAMLVDHTSVGASTARWIAQTASEKGVDFIDAPVSGGQAGAENGQLAIMCGGTEKAMVRATPIMQPYAKSIVHVGSAGAGQTAKLANQMCIAGVLAGLSEAIRLAEASGLDLDKTYQAISGGAAQSWQMDNRWATMTAGKFDFGFAIDWMRKDLANALHEASKLGLSSPITALVDQFYADVQAKGGTDSLPGGRLDTSALITRLPRK